MFASLKNKIKEETGTDPAGAAVNQQRIHNNNNRIRSRYSSTISVNSNQEDLGSGVNNTDVTNHDYLSTLRSQCNELSTKVTELQTRLQQLHDEKQRIEKTNEILLESVKVAQTQKDLYCEEQEKIQNLQQAEIEKLKNLLSFREQEAMDRANMLKQNQQQIENLTAELERLKHYEPMVDDLQLRVDELERLRHSSQLGKNNLTTTLATVEEENRHLKMRLKIVEQARIECINSLSADEKVNALLQERKLLEQHLEEAHLQLSDIKGSWSGQNLALETQVSRLSKQVAEETTEKRKALKERDDLIEKIKQLEFELSKVKDEMLLKDNKITLLEEDIDDLNIALKESREENEHQVVYERNRYETLKTENDDLKKRASEAEERFNDYSTNVEAAANALRLQQTQIQQQLQETQTQLEHEREEKLTALLKNAEISQSEEMLKKELRLERDEAKEMHEKLVKLEENLNQNEQSLAQQLQLLQSKEQELLATNEQLKALEALQHELEEKNKSIKMLTQRLADLKKTVQREFRNSSVKPADGFSDVVLENGHITTNVAAVNPSSAKAALLNSSIASGQIVMDEVNFKYLKHVIVKFLTSREVEARHLIRAVATLLQMTKDEEKLLHDTLNWKMSWFGTKPDHGRGQTAVAIPPS